MKGESALCSKSDDICFSDRPNVQSDNLSLHFSQCEVERMWSFGSERKRECWCQELHFLHDLGHVWACAYASWLEDEKTNGCPIGLMWKCGRLTHTRRLRHKPGHKVDPWRFCKKVTLKGHIIRKVVYFFLPVCQWASLWAVRPRSKQAAYQSDACTDETYQCPSDGKFELQNITLKLNLQQVLEESYSPAQVMGAPGNVQEAFISRMSISECSTKFQSSS